MNQTRYLTRWWAVTRSPILEYIDLGAKQEYLIIGHTLRLSTNGVTIFRLSILMSSYHLSCFSSWLGVKPFQGYEYIPLSDVDDVACRWTCWGCSRLMKIILSFGAILLVLVHLSPTRVSHARKGNRYIHLKWYQIKNYKCMSRIWLRCLLPSIIKRGCGYLVMTRLLMIGVDGNLVEWSSSKYLQRVSCNTREHRIPWYKIAF